MSPPDPGAAGQPLDDLIADMASLHARYPVFDPVRFRALALTTAGHLPDAARADRRLAALDSLWIIAFDEVVDEGELDDRDLRALADACQSVARGLVGAGLHPSSVHPPPAAASPPRAQLVGALGELWGGLERYGPTHALRGYWLDTLCETVDAIVAQRALGRASAGTPGSAAADADLPGILERSIGVSHYLATALILSREAVEREQLAALHPLISSCARAIRYANDLRSRGKDEREANPNSLTVIESRLRREHPAMSDAQRGERALSVLRDWLETETSRVTALSAASTGDDGFARSCARLVAFVTGFYARQDYHTYRPEV